MLTSTENIASFPMQAACSVAARQPMPDHASQNNPAASGFYQAPLPAFIWPRLEQLYHSIFCSLPHLRIHGSLNAQTQAWAGQRNGIDSALLLFESDGHVARVLNEVICLKAADLRQFADALFRHHPPLSAIVLHAIAYDAQPLSYPLHHVEFSEDFVLALPASVAAYMGSLSSQMREKIRYQIRRSQRRYPGLQLRVVQDRQIADADIDAVIRLNQARMAGKGKRFGMDGTEIERLHALMHERGLLAVIDINGVVSAGLLCSKAGDDLYMHVIAHDAQHDDLSLGIVCCYLTIQHAIEARMARFHFLWGRAGYKARLGGVPQPLTRLVLYKSRMHMILHPILLARQCLVHARQWLRQWRAASSKLESGRAHVH
jgi:hypothetical protein